MILASTKGKCSEVSRRLFLERENYTIRGIFQADDTSVQVKKNIRLNPIDMTDGKTDMS